jgi:hypothetical protein
MNIGLAQNARSDPASGSDEKTPNREALLYQRNTIRGEETG